MEWVVIGLALALASGLFGVPYALLFKPWLMKRLAYWLMARSPWYRSWVFRLMCRLMARSARRVTAAMGALVPATKRAAVEMQKFGEALRKAGLVDA